MIDFTGVCSIQEDYIYIQYKTYSFKIARSAQTIDQVIFQPTKTQNQVRQQQINLIRSFEFYEMYGMASLPSSPVLIFVVDRINCASVNCHQIYQIEKVCIVRIIKQSTAEYEQQLYQSFKLMKLYYCPTLDLTRRFQNFFERFPFHSNEFVANLSHTVLYKGYPEVLFVPFFTGFAKTIEVQTGGFLSKLTLISRGNTKRLGRRWLRRGIGISGDTANTYETEMILEIIDQKRHQIFAFNQLRGSIPLLWQQRPCFYPKALLKISGNRDQSRRLLRNYLLSNAQRYGPTTYLNLIDKRGDQLMIGNKFVQQFEASEVADARLIWFSYRDEFMKGNKMDLQTLQSCEQLKQQISEYDYFSAEATAGSQLKCLSLQRGIIRSNCMDCLDRTNHIQSIIAEKVYCRLKEDQQRKGEILQIDEFQRTLKSLWLQNGESISEAYAGTKTMKRGIFLSGKSSCYDLLRDFTIGLKRFYLGHYEDAYYQNCIDLHFGRIKLASDFQSFKKPFFKRVFSLFGLACTLGPIIALYPKITSLKSKVEILLAGCGSFFLGIILSIAVHRLFHQQIVHQPISRKDQNI